MSYGSEVLRLRKQVSSLKQGLREKRNANKDLFGEPSVRPKEFEQLQEVRLFIGFS
jgi:hypothetical protein